MRFFKNTKSQTPTFREIKNDSFNFDLIEKYFKNKNKSDALQVLSNKTCIDLDFQELFMLMDRTSSKLGQQYLYNKLRTIPKKSSQLELKEEIINRFHSDSEFRVKTQKLLLKLNKDDAFYITSLFQDEHLAPPRWFFLVPVLSFTSILCITSLFFSPIFIIPLLLVLITNTAIHYWNKRNLYQYLGSIPQLLKMNSIASLLYKQGIFKDLNIKLPYSIKIINQVKNRMSFFQLEAKIQGDLESAFWGILETFKVCFLLEPLLLFGVLKRLNNKRKEIENVFSFVGEIDSLLSIASLREGSDTYCLPNITNQSENKITAQNIYHPLIHNCVANTINTKNKSVLLSGSNMSGKTSFIRTIGINIITGLTLNTCFAESITLPRTRIYTAIRISDDLMNDKSYYFEEVQTIKEMIDRSVDNISNVFLLDEIFKGTNTVERISAGKAVLSSLAKTNSIVFVSTHDIELTDMLIHQYDLYHFSEIVNHNTVDFDYKIKDGKLKNRNAIRILEINNYPNTIIQDATKTAENLDKKTSFHNKKA